MIYLSRFILPSEKEENDAIMLEHRTCFNTFYPYKVFPPKQLRSIVLDRITMFYGGNGSGKSTLINLMARKVRADRYSDFNDSPKFDEFAGKCRVEYNRCPDVSMVLTSDDVFDYALSARSVNEAIDEKRNALVDKYFQISNEAALNPQVMRLRGLDDFERWSEMHEILSPKKSQSNYIKKRVPRDIDLHSNGETAFRYFLDKIDGDALYFLDEPENSLSIEFQIELAKYISATAVATRSQFIIATHSPIFLSMKDSKVYNLDDCPAGPCEWTELPTVRKYFDFFMEHKGEFK